MRDTTQYAEKQHVELFNFTKKAGMMNRPFSFYASLKERAFSPSTLKEKREIRREMRQRRSHQDPRAARRKNQCIFERIVSLPEWKETRSVALYSAMPDEVQTEAIAQFCLNTGKTVVYPIVIDREIEFFEVKNVELDLCHSGSFGIREPDPLRCEKIPVSSIDLFLVPGIAFDPFGDRVGFGAGYYDRLLIPKRRDARTVALAYEFQVVHAIRTTENDFRMDRIVTDESVYSPQVSHFHCPSESDTRSWAQDLWQHGLKEGDTLALHADLGTGKTVFTQGLAHALEAGRDVVSPTFIYSREYSGTIPLIHVDAYRLDGIAEGDEPFWDELLERPGIRVIEWAEHLGERLPKSTIHCYGQILDDRTREWILFTPLREQSILQPTD